MEVRLEALGVEHADALAPVVGDPDVLRFTRFPDPVPEGWVAEWLDGYEDAWVEGTKYGFAALSGEDLVGCGMVLDVDAEGRQAEIGYLVAPAFRGRGAGTAILRAVTDWAVAELGLVRMELQIDVENVGSQRVAERCGYVLEGVRRSVHHKQGRRIDLQVWGLVRDPDGP